MPGLILRSRRFDSGAGEVWAARRADTGEDRTVRLVPLPPPGPARGIAFRVTHDLVRLRHPHLVDVHEVIPTDDQLAVVTTPAAGTVSLRRVLLVRERLTPGEVVTLGLPIAQALDTAHRAGIGHGALGLEDILLEPSGRPVLSGLGVAALTGIATEPPLDVYDLASLLAAALAGATGPDAAAVARALGPALVDDPDARPDAAGLALALAHSCQPSAVRMGGDDPPPPPPLPPPPPGAAPAGAGGSDEAGDGPAISPPGGGGLDGGGFDGGGIGGGGLDGGGFDGAGIDGGGFDGAGIDGGGFGGGGFDGGGIDGGGFGGGGFGGGGIDGGGFGGGGLGPDDAGFGFPSYEAGFADADPGAPRGPEPVTPASARSSRRRLGGAAGRPGIDPVAPRGPDSLEDSHAGGPDDLPPGLTEPQIRLSDIDPGDLEAVGRQRPRRRLALVAGAAMVLLLVVVVALALARGGGSGSGPAAAPPPTPGKPVAPAPGPTCAAGASTAAPPASVPPPPTGTGPAAAASWRIILTNLYALRDNAFNCDVEADLARAYVPGSPGYVTDLDRLRQVQASQARADGLHVRIQSVAVVSASAGRVVLRVVDVLPAYRYVNLADGALIQTGPAESAKAWTVTLLGSGHSYRIATFVAAN